MFFVFDRVEPSHNMINIVGLAHFYSRKGRAVPCHDLYKVRAVPCATKIAPAASVQSVGRNLTLDSKPYSTVSGSRITTRGLTIFMFPVKRIQIAVKGSNF